MAVFKKLYFFIFVFLLIGIQSAVAHESFIQVIPKAKPSVVIIEVTRFKDKKRAKKAIEALGDNADFFKDELQLGSYKGRGSGFVVESTSHQGIAILTAAHVVKGASKIKVVFENGDRKKAKIIWLNTKKDVALILVEKATAQVPPLAFSESEVVEGQPVLSLSSSFNLSISGSQGIVSAVDVVLPGKRKLKLIQTDATINPGSSGGPLLNLSLIHI